MRYGQVPDKPPKASKFAPKVMLDKLDAEGNKVMKKDKEGNEAGVDQQPFFLLPKERVRVLERIMVDNKGKSDEYIKVDVRGQQGWIAATYVVVEGECLHLHLHLHTHPVRAGRPAAAGRARSQALRERCA